MNELQPQGPVVVEIGPGTSSFAFYASKSETLKNGFYLGLDKDIGVARFFNKSLFIAGLAEQLPLKDGVVDQFLLFNVLGEWRYYKRKFYEPLFEDGRYVLPKKMADVFRQMRGSLKQGGLITICEFSTPSETFPKVDFTSYGFASEVHMGDDFEKLVRGLNMEVIPELILADEPENPPYLMILEKL